MENEVNADQDCSEKGVHIPKVFCDHCGEMIETASDGNYQWDMEAASDNAEVFFTHKRCCHAFEKAHPLPEGLWGAEELHALPEFLKMNLRSDFKKSKTALLRLAADD